MWLNMETALEMSSKHMKGNVENQIMANAPSLVWKSYVDNHYHSITADAKTRVLESDNRKK
jgi:hypothetical protein